MIRNRPLLYCRQEVLFESLDRRADSGGRDRCLHLGCPGVGEFGMLPQKGQEPQG